jgi:hypothetical protein
MKFVLIIEKKQNGLPDVINGAVMVLLMHLICEIFFLQKKNKKGQVMCNSPFGTASKVDCSKISIRKEACSYLFFIMKEGKNM